MPKHNTFVLQFFFILAYFLCSCEYKFEEEVLWEHVDKDAITVTHYDANDTVEFYVEQNNRRYIWNYIGRSYFVIPNPDTLLSFLQCIDIMKDNISDKELLFTKVQKDTIWLVIYHNDSLLDSVKTNISGQNHDKEPGWQGSIGKVILEDVNNDGHHDIVCTINTGAVRPSCQDTYRPFDL